MLFLGVGFQILGFRCGEICEGFFHKGVQLTGLGEHLIEMLFAFGGNEGGKQNGKSTDLQVQTSHLF